MAEQAPSQVARPLLAAGVLFFDADGRVLLVKPTYKPAWEIPGGYVEPDESPLQACIREVKEELGIAPRIGRMLVTDWAPHPGQGDKLLFIFDGGTLSEELSQEINLQTAELSEWRFHESATLDEALIPRLTRRVHAAIRARAHHTTEYLEHGEQP